MTLAFVHVIAHLPHFWQVGGGLRGWWAQRQFGTWGMEGFGQKLHEGHWAVISAAEWR